MKTLTRAALAASMFGLCAAAASGAWAAGTTNYVMNGSFELPGPGSFQDWTFTGNNNTTGQGTQDLPYVLQYNSTNPGAYGEAVTPDNAATIDPDAVGNYAAYFSSDYATEAESQSITLAPGTYDFGFSVYQPLNSSQNAGDATLIGSFDNQQLTYALSASNNPVQTWQTYNAQFTVGPGGYTGNVNFQFDTNFGPSKDVVLDEVYVISAAPEPATWGLMIAGVAMAGLGLRFRRRNDALVAA